MASKIFGDAPWPKEGHTLGAMIKNLVSAEEWHELLDQLGEAGRSRGQIIPLLISGEPRDLRRYDGASKIKAAIQACLPLIEAWNSGAITAKARFGPFEALVDIPPPITGYTLTVESFVYSRIIDRSSAAPKKIYDVRFFEAELVKERKTALTAPGAQAALRRGWRR